MLNNNRPLWHTTYSYTSSSPSTPEFNLTRNRNRLKLYPNNKIYLNDKDNFELEIFNPNSSVIGFKVLLNGKYISDRLIVLKPAERVYLERFIDTNAKFLFDTYHVEANNKEVDKIIAQNGLVEVEFYSVKAPVTRGLSLNEGNSNFCTIGGTSNGYYTNNFTTQLTNNSTFTCSTDSLGSSSLSEMPMKKILRSSLAKTEVKEKETGRIEQGTSSNQNFKTVDYDFESFSFSRQSVQIMPMSEKPVELDKLRSYCTACAYRVRDEKWKFCPKCGTEV